MHNSTLSTCLVIVLLLVTTGPGYAQQKTDTPKEQAAAVRSATKDALKKVNDAAKAGVQKANQLADTAIKAGEDPKTTNQKRQLTIRQVQTAAGKARSAIDAQSSVLLNNIGGGLVGGVGDLKLAIERLGGLANEFVGEATTITTKLQTLLVRIFQVDYLRGKNRTVTAVRALIGFVSVVPPVKIKVTLTVAFHSRNPELSPVPPLGSTTFDLEINSKERRDNVRFTLKIGALPAGTKFVSIHVVADGKDTISEHADTTFSFTKSGK